MDNKLCLLTKSEVEKIQKWISDNDYSVYKGYFDLRFSFNPLGDTVDFEYVSGNQTKHLVVDDDFNNRSNMNLDAGFLKIGDVSVNLELSDEALKKYSNYAQKTTEAHVNEECEPPGAYIDFKIFSFGYEIYAQGNIIDAVYIPFRRLPVKDNKKLIEDVSIIKVKEDPNVLYFDASDTEKIVNRAYDMGFEVYGIECWSSVDIGYFKTYVEEGYADEFNVPEKEWAKDAVKRLIREYKELVLKKEPNNPPIFNLTIGKN